jgi:hypothetical protein
MVYVLDSLNRELTGDGTFAFITDAVAVCIPLIRICIVDTVVAEVAVPVLIGIVLIGVGIDGAVVVIVADTIVICVVVEIDIASVADSVAIGVLLPRIRVFGADVTGITDPIVV